MVSRVVCCNDASLAVHRKLCDNLVLCNYHDTNMTYHDIDNDFELHFGRFRLSFHINI